MPNTLRRGAKSDARLQLRAVALLLIWLLILILGAPLNHDGRRQALRSGHPGMDAGVAATRPGMADRGGPTEQCLTAGMPSLSEAPSGGARALCLLWGSSKVSRRKGGTNSRRHTKNGYAPRRTHSVVPIFQSRRRQSCRTSKKQLVEHRTTKPAPS
jgi:hypothetical protein